MVPRRVAFTGLCVGLAVVGLFAILIALHDLASWESERRIGAPDLLPRLMLLEAAAWRHLVCSPVGLFLSLAGGIPAGAAAWRLWPRLRTETARLLRRTAAAGALVGILVPLLVLGAELCLRWSVAPGGPRPFPLADVLSDYAAVEPLAAILGAGFGLATVSVGRLLGIADSPVKISGRVQDRVV